MRFLSDVDPADVDDPVTHVEHEVKPRLEERRRALRADFPLPDYWLALPPSTDSLPRGLNTFGWLIDRLSIQAVKHWNLSRQEKGGEQVRSDVTADLVAALAVTLPGKLATQKKVTHLVDASTYADLGDAFCALMTIHTCFWEKQDISYGSKVY